MSAATSAVDNKISAEIGGIGDVDFHEDDRFTAGDVALHPLLEFLDPVLLLTEVGGVVRDHCEIPRCVASVMNCTAVSSNSTDVARSSNARDTLDRRIRP